METNQSIIWSLVQIYKSAKVICAQTDSVYLLFFFFLSGVQKPTQASQILGHISAKTNGVKLKRKKNTPGADRMYSCCFLTAFGHAWTAFIGSIGEILHAETTLQKGGGKTHQALHKSTPDTNLLLNYNMGFCSLLPHWWRPFIPRVTHSMLSTWNTWLLVTLEMFAVLSTFQKKKKQKKSLLPVGIHASPTTRTSTRQHHWLHSPYPQHSGIYFSFLLARINREA